MPRIARDPTRRSAARRSGLCLPAAAALLALSAPASGQQGPPAESIEVFLDCQTFGCDSEFLRTEIDWVSWVRDRQVADVHVLVTGQGTGAGGRRYELAFIGRGDFDAMGDTLHYAAPPAATEDEQRGGLARAMAAGLIRYAAETALLDRLSISARAPREDEASTRVAGPVDDPWNFWVFSVSGSTNLEGESRQDELDTDGRISANRTTADWKLDFDVTASYRREHFELSDDTITTDRHDYGVSGLVVKSLGGHLSAGINTEVESATFSNQDLAITVAPAVEYNLYPYSEFTRRQLTFLYSIGPAYYDYEQPTLWNRQTDRVLRQSLEADLDLRQPWGSARLGVEGSHIIGWEPGPDLPPGLDVDEPRYRLSANASLEVRLFRGLELQLRGDYTRIRDQISLPLEDYSDDEILLEIRELETGYRYEMRVGLSYTFGSIYNTVVNPRFGGFGRGGGRGRDFR